MAHFEDFWVYAEALGNQFDNEDIGTIISKIQDSIDSLPLMSNLPARQAEVIGDVIFELCKITNKLNINSAAALHWTTEKKKAELLDPDEEIGNA